MTLEDLIILAVIQKQIEEGGGGHMPIELFYVCSADEIDEDGYPTVETPSENKFYLTPSETEGHWIVWIYRNGYFDPINKATIDLTDYVKRVVADRATNTQLGLVMVNPTHGVTTSAEGYLMASVRTAEQVAGNSGTAILGVGTLRNLTVDFTCVGKDGTTTHYYLPSVPPKA